MQLETARLVIRTFKQSDADAWLAMVTDPDVRRFLPVGPAPTMETFAKALEQRRALEREHGFTMWAVDAKDTGKFVGQCGIRPIEEHGPENDLAYHFNKASWNKGYATEEAIAVLGYAFGKLGLRAVMAVVMPENIGSWRVAENAGMRFAGHATYYGIEGVKKYIAEREWWSAPQRQVARTLSSYLKES